MATNEQITSTVRGVIEGTAARTGANAEQIYKHYRDGWGLPETVIEPGGTRGIPISKTVKNAHRHPEYDTYSEFIEGEYGHKHAFALAAATGPDYDGGLKTFDTSVLGKGAEPDETRAVIDESVVGAATPIEFDPQIVDVLRSAAPVLDVITMEAQAGFTASYNIISARSDPVGFLSETDAVDLSDNSDSDFTLANDQKDMKIWVDKVNISDFSQRAEDSLNYMDLTETTLGQRTKEHALQKAKAIFYGDPSVGETNGSVEDANAYEGLAKIAVDAGQNESKSSVASGFLEDLKSELTDLVSNSGLTYNRAHILVSPEMFDALENEANPVVRLDGYDESLNFGGRQINVKGVPVTECPNINAYTMNTTNFTPDTGDVFIIDEQAIRFRQLAPLSTIPLGRVGLADRAAMFEYGTLIDKSQGNHLKYLEGYDV